MIKTGKKGVLFYGAVIGLLILLYFFGFLAPAEKLITRGLNPLLSWAHRASTALRIKYDEQFSKVDREQRINDLEAQLAALIEENAKFNKLDEENKLLREHLGFLANKEYKYVLANVIARGEEASITDITETIIIDRGEADGLEPGLAVVSSRGMIIGKISEVHPASAKIYLTNNTKCRLAVSVMNEAKTSGVVEGELGLTIRMGFIPQTEIIKENDLIITSGLEKNIPRGLVVGRVLEVLKESNKLWQAAVVEPVTDLNDLIIVSVLLP